MNCASSAISSRIVPTSSVERMKSERLSKYRKPKTVAKAVGSATLRSVRSACRVRIFVRRRRCVFATISLYAMSGAERPAAYTAGNFSCARSGAACRTAGATSGRHGATRRSTPARRADKVALLILFFTLSRDLPRDRRKGRKFAAGMPDLSRNSWSPCR